jgi:hypothetical protein
VTAALIGFTLVLLASAGAGMALLRALRAESDHPAERFVLGSAVGLGVLAYAVLAAGLLGWLRLGVLVALVAVEGLLGAAALLAWLRSLVRGRPVAGPAPAAAKPAKSSASASTLTRPIDPETLARGAAAALGLFGLFIAGCTLIGALAPPNGDDWDSLAYHLAAPKIYLAEGTIRFLPYDSHTNFPFTLEMLYTVGLAFGGAPGAKLFHWAAGWLTALGIAAFCRRLFPHGSSGPTMPVWGPPLAAALFLGIPQVQWQATTAYIDLGTTLYQFLALVAFVYAVSGRETRSLGWLVVSGLMSGWAMGTKYTALLPFGLLVLGGAVWAALGHSGIQAFRRSGVQEDSQSQSGHQVIRSSGHHRWLGVATMATVAVLVASPWYLKSYLWTNNPVYPFLYSLFPDSVQWTRQAAEAYEHEQAFFGLGKGPLALLMAPWNLAMNGWAFFTVLTRHAPPGTLPYFDGLQRGGLSAAFLGLVPLALYTRQWDRRLTGLVLYALALLVPWFFLTQQSRYLLPVVASLAVVAAAVVANLEVDLTRWAAGIFVAVILLLHGAWGAQHVLARALPVVSGQVSRGDYLQRTFQAYEAMEFLNQLPPGGKVAFFQETRGFYLDRPYLWANPLQNTLIPYETLPNGAELVRFMKERLGVTHVLFNRPGAAGSENDEWYRLLKDAITCEALVLLHESRGVEVYAVRD